MPSTPDIDVSALAEALNEKLDRDGFNATNDIKEMMANMGMPSDRYIDLTLPANGGTVTAPADGYVRLYVNSGLDTGVSSGAVVYLGSARVVQAQATACPGAGIGIVLPVCKGDTILVGYNARGGSVATFKFIYANGSQHLASN